MEVAADAEVSLLLPFLLLLLLLVLLLFLLLRLRLLLLLLSLLLLLLLLGARLEVAAGADVQRRQQREQVPEGGPPEDRLHGRRLTIITYY